MELTWNNYLYRLILTYVEYLYCGFFSMKKLYANKSKSGFAGALYSEG